MKNISIGLLILLALSGCKKDNDKSVENLFNEVETVKKAEVKPLDKPVENKSKVEEVKKAENKPLVTEETKTETKPVIKLDTKLDTAIEKKPETIKEIKKPKEKKAKKVITYQAEDNHQSNNIKHDEPKAIQYEEPKKAIEVSKPSNPNEKPYDNPRAIPGSCKRGVYKTQFTMGGAVEYVECKEYW